MKEFKEKVRLNIIETIGTCEHKIAEYKETVEFLQKLLKEYE